MRRRLGRHHAGRAPADAPGLGGDGAELNRYAVATAELNRYAVATAQLNRYAVATAHGPARIELSAPAGAARALVVLGHGAGGGIEAPDLRALAAALPAAGFTAALLEQPYRVAGRRTPAPAAQLDAAWATAVEELRRQPALAGLALVAGGRSSGARVACRTAAATGAIGVIALAFPLRPPGRPVDRLAELLAVPVPTLVVQGARDPFGGVRDFPPGLPAAVELVEIGGADHSFRVRRADGGTAAKRLADVVAAVLGWLDRRCAASPRVPG